MKFSRGNSAGFTLTELLMAAAILGIMSALAVPAYNGYMARGRQQQAKTFLSMIHTQEDIFFTETGTFTGCLRQIGVDLSAEKSLWYSTGVYTHAATPACGPNGDDTTCTGYKYDYTGAVSASCGVLDYHFFSNACSRPDMYPNCQVTMDQVYGVYVNRYTYTAQAAGNVSNKITKDIWTIDHNRNLLNVLPGI